MPDDARARALAAVGAVRQAEADWRAATGSAPRQWRWFCDSRRQLGSLWRDIEALLKEDRKA